MENYTSKYFGILKHIKEDYVNKNVFEEILKFNLFDEFPLSNGYFGSSYFGLELESNNFKADFNDFFLYNYKEYNLKSSVWKDMFNSQAQRVELQHLMSDFEINDYVVNFHSLTTKDEKLDFLKELNADFLKLYKNKDLLFLYLKGEPARGYKSWEEYYISEQVENENFTYIFNFLKGSQDFYPKEAHKQWREFRIYKDILEFINEKLTSLEETTKPNVVEKISVFEDWRSDIFKDKQCRSLFDFIINEYPTEKNTSFFSMLYKYFQQNTHIIIEDNDSKDYRDFITKNYNLESFKRIQPKTSNKENNKWDKVFRKFEVLEEKFTQKFE